MMKHLLKKTKKSELPLFSYDYWKCMFVDFVTGYISPSLSVE